jgi:CheY-like chemotaxis protein
MMDGEITVESEVDKGSRFRFSARLARPAAEARAPRRPAETLEGTRVLVVDDNDTNRRILEELLRQWRMEPVALGRASAVLGALVEAQERGESFHIVLLDANMPELDGFALAERLRDEPRVGSPIVMMLSSADRPGDVRRCKELGIDVYLLKPIKQSDLLTAIERALGIRAVAGEAAPEPEPMPPLAILLAEDNRVSQRLAVGLLKRWGHTVTVAANGREALDAVRSQPGDAAFDLILMDVQMPDMDGLESTGAIRALERERGGHIPIVAMTAHAMKGDRERCLAAGMDGYLPKPIRSEELRFTLERYTPPEARRRRAHEAAEPGPGEEEPALDWDLALERVERRDPILRAMAAAFVEECPSWVEEIETALDEDNSEALRRAAHSLKGAAQALAARPLADLATRLEVAGREHRVAAAAAERRELAAKTDALVAELSRRLGAPGKGEHHAP